MRTSDKYTVRYDDNDGSLWLTVDGVNYLLSQSSGELIGADGHTMGDLYWKDIKNGSAEVVKQIFSDIAAQSAQIARLREALEPFAKIYAELKTGDAIFIIGKDKKHIVVSLEWFSLAARALEETK